MNNIDRIIIGCNKIDFHLLKICVASIRYWNSEIPIFIIKDELNGTFDTSSLENNWDVNLYPCALKKLGWGIGTLIPLCTVSNKRCLYLDADVVLLGDITTDLNKIDSDIIVSPDTPDNIREHIENAYFSLSRIKKIDPNFEVPEFVFNTGHLVYNEGILAKELFDTFIDWQSVPPNVLDKDTFKFADQSILNFLLTKLLREGKLSIERHQFNIWGFDEQTLNQVSLTDIGNKKGNQKLIHWAGLKTNHIQGMPRADILGFYEDYYYAKVRYGKIQKHFSHVIQWKKEAVFLTKKMVVRIRDKTLSLR